MRNQPESVKVNVGWPEIFWGEEYILEEKGHLTPLPRDQMSSQRYHFIAGMIERIAQVEEKNRRDAEKKLKQQRRR